MSVSPFQKLPTMVRPVPVVPPSGAPLPQVWGVSNPRNAWRLAKAANDNVARSITARAFVSFGFRLASAALSVIGCTGDTPVRDNPLSDPIPELEDLRQRLQEWETQRRNLRWYDSDDLNLMPHLDKSIARLRTKIQQLEHQQEIGMHEMRLRLFHPDSAEAQQLRQKIANLKAALALPAMPLTAARAQAGDGDSAASAPAAPSAGEGEKKKETLDELLAAIGERQKQLRPKSVLPVRVDDYVRKIFARNPEGARLMVRLALANDDDMESIVDYARRNYIPSDADLVRLSHFLMKMENQGTRVTGEVLWTMTSGNNQFVQNMVLISTAGAMRLHLNYNRFWVARPGQPVRQVNCVFASWGLVAIAKFSSAMVNQLLDRPYDTQNRSFSKSFHLALPISDGVRHPPIGTLMADIVLPPWLDHLQISYVKEDSDGNAMTVSRSLEHPTPRDLPRVTTLAELDQLLADVKFENSYDEMLERVAAKTLAYPNAASFRYSVSFDPQKVPIAIRHIRKELLTPAPLLFDISPGNRELVAMANLQRLVRSSAMKTALGDDAMQRQIRADVQLFTPKVIQWIDDVQKNGRHLWAIDTYFALVSSGLLAVDPKVVEKILPDSDRWTAENQRFVYRLLLDHDTPQAIVMNALSKLHPVIMTDLTYVTPETPVESVILILGGIEVLAQWQDLSGAETKSVAQFLRHLMTTASPEIQKHAIITYMAVINSGYLSLEDVQDGIVDVAVLSGNSDHAVAALALGTLIQLARWVTPETLSRLQLKPSALGESAHADFLSTRMSVAIAALNEAIVRTAFPDTPRPASADWSDIWHDLADVAEIHDSQLQDAAHAFSISYSMLWSPLLNEAGLVADLQKKIVLASNLEEAEYLKSQYDVLEEFVTSPRRRKIWERIAHSDDAAAKQQLQGLCEHRLKAGGTDHELSEIQRVRNIILNRPQISSETLRLERLYLQAMWAQMNGSIDTRTQWYGTKRLDYNGEFEISPKLRSIYFARELLRPQPVSGVSREVQQLVVLSDLWHLLQTGYDNDGELIYQGVAPLLVSENNEVAYGAAIVANELMKKGVHGVDNVRVQYLLFSAALRKNNAYRDYPGSERERIGAIELLMHHQMLVPEEIRSAWGFVLDGIHTDTDEILELKSLRIASLMINSGALTSNQIDGIIELIVYKLQFSTTPSCIEGCLDALEKVVPHIKRGQENFHYLEQVELQITQPSWKEKIRQLLNAIENQ